MIFDIAVAAVFLISCIIAFLRGFIRETLTIAGVVGGAFASIYAGPMLSPTVHLWLGVGGAEAGAGAEAEPEKLFGVLPMSIVADIATYGGIFIVVVLVLSLISHMLSGWAKAVGLGAFDRSFGVLFGIARAAVLVALLYLPVFVMVDEETRDGWFVDSKTRVYVEAASGWAKNMLPESMAENMQKQADEGIGKTAREKLQEIDMLRKDNPDEAPAENINGDGYKDEERSDFNQMLDKNFND